MFRKLLLLFLLVLSASPAVYGTTFYVDSTNGNDANAGNSPSSPWKTLTRLASSKFMPGDIILLRRGSVWREQLNFPSSGSAAAPIVIDAYGAGNLPAAAGRPQQSRDGQVTARSARSGSCWGSRKLSCSQAVNAAPP